MIKERTGFRDLVLADILERLTTFEMEEYEKRDVNGSRRRTHALKAKASRPSSLDASSVSSGESDDPPSIAKDLAPFMRHLNRFQRKSSSSPRKNNSSRHSSISARLQLLLQVQETRPL